MKYKEISSTTFNLNIKKIAQFHKKKAIFKNQLQNYFNKRFHFSNPYFFSILIFFIFYLIIVSIIILLPEIQEQIQTVGFSSDKSIDYLFESYCNIQFFSRATSSSAFFTLNHNLSENSNENEYDINYSIKQKENVSFACNLNIYFPSNVKFKLRIKCTQGCSVKSKNLNQIIMELTFDSQSPSDLIFQKMDFYYLQINAYQSTLFLKQVVIRQGDFTTSQSTIQVLYQEKARYMINLMGERVNYFFGSIKTIRIFDYQTKNLWLGKELPLTVDIYDLGFEDQEKYELNLNLVRTKLLFSSMEIFNNNILYQEKMVDLKSVVYENIRGFNKFQNLDGNFNSLSEVENISEKFLSEVKKKKFILLRSENCWEENEEEQFILVIYQKNYKLYNFIKNQWIDPNKRFLGREFSFCIPFNFLYYLQKNLGLMKLIYSNWIENYLQQQKSNYNVLIFFPKPEQTPTNKKDYYFQSEVRPISPAFKLLPRIFSLKVLLFTKNQNFISQPYFSSFYLNDLTISFSQNYTSICVISIFIFIIFYKIHVKIFNDFVKEQKRINKILGYKYEEYFSFPNVFKLLFTIDYTEYSTFIIQYYIFSFSNYNLLQIFLNKLFEEKKQVDLFENNYFDQKVLTKQKLIKLLNVFARIWNFQYIKYQFEKFNEILRKFNYEVQLDQNSDLYLRGLSFSKKFISQFNVNKQTSLEDFMKIYSFKVNENLKINVNDLYDFYKEHLKAVSNEKKIKKKEFINQLRFYCINEEIQLQEKQVYVLTPIKKNFPMVNYHFIQLLQQKGSYNEIQLRQLEPKLKFFDWIIFICAGFFLDLFLFNFSQFTFFFRYKKNVLTANIIDLVFYQKFYYYLSYLTFFIGILVSFIRFFIEMKYRKEIFANKPLNIILNLFIWIVIYFNHINLGFIILLNFLKYEWVKDLNNENLSIIIIIIELILYCEFFVGLKVFSLANKIQKLQITQKNYRTVLNHMENLRKKFQEITYKQSNMNDLLITKQNFKYYVLKEISDLFKDNTPQQTKEKYENLLNNIKSYFNQNQQDFLIYLLARINGRTTNKAFFEIVLQSQIQEISFEQIELGKIFLKLQNDQITDIQLEKYIKKLLLTLQLITEKYNIELIAKEIRVKQKYQKCQPLLENDKILIDKLISLEDNVQSIWDDYWYLLILYNRNELINWKLPDQITIKNYLDAKINEILLTGNYINQSYNDFLKMIFKLKIMQNIKKYTLDQKDVELLIDFINIQNLNFTIQDFKKYYIYNFICSRNLTLSFAFNASKISNFNNDKQFIYFLQIINYFKNYQKKLINFSSNTNNQYLVKLLKLFKMNINQLFIFMAHLMGTNNSFIFNLNSMIFKISYLTDEEIDTMNTLFTLFKFTNKENIYFLKLRFDLNFIKLFQKVYCGKEKNLEKIKLIIKQQLPQNLNENLIDDLSRSLKEKNFQQLDQIFQQIKELKQFRKQKEKIKELFVQYKVIVLMNMENPPKIHLMNNLNELYQNYLITLKIKNFFHVYINFLYKIKYKTQDQNQSENFNYGVISTLSILLNIEKSLIFDFFQMISEFNGKNISLFLSKHMNIKMNSKTLDILLHNVFQQEQLFNFYKELELKSYNEYCESIQIDNFIVKLCIIDIQDINFMEKFYEKNYYLEFLQNLNVNEEKETKTINAKLIEFLNAIFQSLQSNNPCNLTKFVRKYFPNYDIVQILIDQFFFQSKDILQFINKIQKSLKYVPKDFQQICLFFFYLKGKKIPLELFINYFEKISINPLFIYFIEAAKGNYLSQSVMINSLLFFDSSFNKESKIFFVEKIINFIQNQSSEIEKNSVQFYLKEDFDYLIQSQKQLEMENITIHDLLSQSKFQKLLKLLKLQSNEVKIFYLLNSGKITLQELKETFQFYEIQNFEEVFQIFTIFQIKQKKFLHKNQLIGLNTLMELGSDYFKKENPQYLYSWIYLSVYKSDYFMLNKLLKSYIIPKKLFNEFFENDLNLLYFYKEVNKKTNLFFKLQKIHELDQKSYRNLINTQEKLFMQIQKKNTLYASLCIIHQSEKYFNADFIKKLEVNIIFTNYWWNLVSKKINFKLIKFSIQYYIVMQFKNIFDQDEFLEKIRQSLEDYAQKNIIGKYLLMHRNYQSSLSRYIEEGDEDNSKEEKIGKSDEEYVSENGSLTSFHQKLKKNDVQHHILHNIEMNKVLCKNFMQLFENEQDFEYMKNQWQDLENDPFTYNMEQDIYQKEKQFGFEKLFKNQHLKLMKQNLMLVYFHTIENYLKQISKTKQLLKFFQILDIKINEEYFQKNEQSNGILFEFLKFFAVREISKNQLSPKLQKLIQLLSRLQQVQNILSLKFPNNIYCQKIFTKIIQLWKGTIFEMDEQFEKIGDFETNIINDNFEEILKNEKKSHLFIIQLLNLFPLEKKLTIYEIDQNFLVNSNLEQIPNETIQNNFYSDCKLFFSRSCFNIQLQTQWQQFKKQFTQEKFIYYTQFFKKITHDSDLSNININFSLINISNITEHNQYIKSPHQDLNLFCKFLSKGANSKQLFQKLAISVGFEKYYNILDDNIFKQEFDFHFWLKNQRIDDFSKTLLSQFYKFVNDTQQNGDIFLEMSLNLLKKNSDKYVKMIKEVYQCHFQNQKIDNQILLDILFQNYPEKEAKNFKNLLQIMNALIDQDFTVLHELSEEIKQVFSTYFQVDNQNIIYIFGILENFQNKVYNKTVLSQNIFNFFSNTDFNIQDINIEHLEFLFHFQYANYNKDVILLLEILYSFRQKELYCDFIMLYLYLSVKINKFKIQEDFYNEELLKICQQYVFLKITIKIFKEKSSNKKILKAINKLLEEYQTIIVEQNWDHILKLIKYFHHKNQKHNFQYFFSEKVQYIKEFKMNQNLTPEEWYVDVPQELFHLYNFFTWNPSFFYQVIQNDKQKEIVDLILIDKSNSNFNKIKNELKIQKLFQDYEKAKNKALQINTILTKKISIYEAPNVIDLNYQLQTKDFRNQSNQRQPEFQKVINLLSQLTETNQVSQNFKVFSKIFYISKYEKLNQIILMENIEWDLIYHFQQIIEHKEFLNKEFYLYFIKIMQYLKFEKKQIEELIGYFQNFLDFEQNIQSNKKESYEQFENHKKQLVSQIIYEFFLTTQSQKEINDIQILKILNGFLELIPFEIQSTQDIQELFLILFGGNVEKEILMKNIDYIKNNEKNQLSRLNTKIASEMILELIQQKIDQETKKMGKESLELNFIPFFLKNIVFLAFAYIHIEISPFENNEKNLFTFNVFLLSFLVCFILYLAIFYQQIVVRLYFT